MDVMDGGYFGYYLGYGWVGELYSKLAGWFAEAGATDSAQVQDLAETHQSAG